MYVCIIYSDTDKDRLALNFFYCHCSYSLPKTML